MHDELCLIDASVEVEVISEALFLRSQDEVDTIQYLTAFDLAEASDAVQPARGV
jgi:hypothetical protein